MKLYRTTFTGNDIEIADIEIDERTTYEEELQGGGLINCSFTLSRMIDIRKGDYAIWRGRKFFTEEVVPVHKKKTNEYDYNFKMYDFYFYLKDAIHQFNNELDFYFFGDLRKHAELLIESFNKIGRKTITIGNMPETEPKNLKFYNIDCESVLHQLCKEWGVEFQFIGDSLSFAEKVGNPTGLVFKFKDGIRGIERKKVNDASLITRLYAFGAERNIPKDYGSKRLRIEPLEARISEFGAIEAAKEFNEIYPHRTGVISAVNNDDICKFSDSSLDFDVNKQAIEGVTVKLTFTSGDLSGQEFEVHSYDHSAKEFDIISKTDETNTEFPSDTFKPKVGDKYVLHDIIMPQSYVDEAENKLRQKATEYLEKYSIPQMSYEITPDYVKLRRDGIELNVGDITTTEDRAFNISASTRIIGLSQVLASPFKYTLKVGDKATISYLKRTLAKQVELDIALRVERDNRKADYRRMRRGLMQVEELQSSIFDQDGYFDTTKIKPLSIETNMLSVGSRSLRMSFEGLSIKPNFNNNPKLVNISASKLIHFTIADEVKEWNFPQKTLSLPDASKYYYLYAKCHKSGSGGAYYATTEKLGIEDATYYYFLIGVIHSVIDGIRGTSLQYGQTYINGKFITTGVIKSANNKMLIDLENGEIQGNIKFYGSGGSTKDLADWAGITDGNIIDAQHAANQANSKAEQAIQDVAQSIIDYNEKIEGVQQQIDGEISSWFYPYTPALSNYPANGWGSNKEKDRHIGDTFTNTQEAPATNAGKSWRFVKSGNSYKWTLIADSDAVKALQKASKAQSTADGKSTIYMTQPTSYCFGDFWVLNSDKVINGVQYKQSDLLQATQDSNVFVDSHWRKPLRYIDEDKARELDDAIEIGGNNLVVGNNKLSTQLIAYDNAPLIIVEDNGNNVSFYTGNGDQSNSLKAYYGVNLSEEITEGEDCVFSVFVKNTRTDDTPIDISFKGLIPYKTKTLLPSDGLKRLVFKGKRNDYPYLQLFFKGKNKQYAVSAKFERIQLEKGNKVTGFSVSQADISLEMEKMQTELSQEIDENKQAFENFKNNTFEAFKDGIIDKPEKEAIKSHKQILTNEKEDLKKQWHNISNSEYLTDNSQLNAKWNNYKSKFNALISAIDNAITDNKITDSERQAVENGFNNYRNALTTLRDELEDAIRFIENTKINAIKIDSNNIIDDSGISNAFPFQGSSEYVSEDNYRTLVVDNEHDTGVLCLFRAVDKKYLNTELTFSVEVEAPDGGVEVQLFVGKYDNDNYANIKTGEWKNISNGIKLLKLTFIADSVNIRFYVRRKKNNNELRVYNGYMITEGNNAVRWQPSENDRLSIIEDKILSNTVFYEYSKNKTNWHLEFQADDIWMRTKKGKGSWSSPAKIVGENGKNGKYTDYQFAKNTSIATPPTNGWQDAPPANNEGEYIWMRTGVVTPPATIPASWSTPIRMTGGKGNKGDDGIPGKDGKDGKPVYFHIKYAPNAHPQDWEMSEVPDAYIGTYVDNKEKDSTIALMYTWSRFKGMDGNDGIPGKDGENGKTTYLHIAYADDENGGGFSQNGAGKSYIGTYTDFKKTDSNNPNKYTWKKFRGEPITSDDEPTNKYVGMVWIDTSKNPAEQKVWTGEKWDFVGLREDDIKGLYSPNIINDSSIINAKVYHGNSDYIEDDNYRTLTINNDYDEGFLYLFRTIDKKYLNTELTFSVEVEAPDGDVPVRIFVGKYDDGVYTQLNTSVWENIENGIKLLKVTFSTDSVNTRLYVRRKKNNNELRIYNGFMVTEGTKAVRWQKSETDKENDIEPTKKAAKYLSKALEESTEVQGGLVLASVIGAKNSNGAVESYMSGNSAANPIAFAAGVQHFGTQGEKQKVAINHDGTAKVGVFTIDATGTVRILDNEILERIGFYSGKINNLNDILNVSNYSDSDQNSNDVVLNKTDASKYLGVKVSAVKDGGYIDFNATMEFKLWGNNEDLGFQAFNKIDSNNFEIAGIAIKLLLFKNGEYLSEITSEVAAYNRTINIDKRIHVNSGSYTVMAIFQRGTNYDGKVTISNTALNWKLDTSEFRKLVFGVNGFLGAFPDKLFYFSEQEGLVVKGKTNLPGVLESASCNNYGTQSNYWGVFKRRKAERVSIGRYRVSHNIGHDEYTVTCTPHYGHGAMSVQIGVRTSDYFEVYFFNADGDLTNTGFDYIIHGNNF